MYSRRVAQNYLTFPWNACFSGWMDTLPDLLRAARCLLGYTQTGIEKRLNLKKRSVYTFEARRYKLTPRFAFLLKDHYEGEGVEFVDADAMFGTGIRWRTPGRKDPYKRVLLLGARGLADLSQEQLADIAGLDRSFIARLEQDEFEGVSSEKLARIESALRKRNVEFTLDTSTSGAGVRWINANHYQKPLAD